MKLLLVADFACYTGFATVAQNVAKFLRSKWEIDVLAINYHGDPHPLQKSYNIFPAGLEGNVFGLNRINRVIAQGNYDLIFIINDIWIINMYLEQMKKLEKRPPVVFYTPVDAKHLKRGFIEPLNQLANHGIFYTKFGLGEALTSGLNIPTSVIPHGVDATNFHYMPRKEARKETGIPEDWFVALMVNRNQPRKRLDLGIYYFSEWVKRTNKPDNVRLYYHGALNDIGIDVEDYAQYCGIEERLIITSRDMTMQNMLPYEKLKFVYNSANFYMTPCASEGWGLTLMEALACAIPSIAPRSSALGEWPIAKDGAVVEYVECYENMPFVNTGMVNTIMDTPKLEDYIEAMEKLYNDQDYAKRLGYRGFKHVTSAQFEWKNIAAQFDTVFQQYARKG